MSASDSDASDYEIIDPVALAADIADEKKIDVERINAWLNPTKYNAPSSEYRRHLSSQSPGTGEWIRETKQFKQWFSSDSHGSIWIKAVPGAGKSVVAASMTDSLAREHGGSAPVLFFFFRQIIESNRTARALLRDWMAQLLSFSKILQVILWDYVEGKKDLESISTAQLWKHLLYSLTTIDRVYCIVDALDEMTIDEEFLGRLNELGAFRPEHVKLLMTSRPKQYLQRSLRDPQVIHVALEEELVKRDISVFVSQKSAELDIDSETQSFVENTICERSQGLFLYARLMLDQLEQATKEHGKKDVSWFRQMLLRLPVGLEEMYNQVLFDHANKFNVSQETQLLILQLVTHSSRPLRLIEVATAVETSNFGSNSGTNNKNSKEIVRVACGPLLEIMEDEVVQILHHSFTEYLLDSSRLERHSDVTPQFPIINPTAAHRAIALTCLTSLQGSVFSSYPKLLEGRQMVGPRRGDSRGAPDFNFRPVFLQYPLAEYAAENWMYHARQYDCWDEAFFNQLSQFCTSGTDHFRAWQGLLSKSNPGSVAMNASPLHVGAGFGLLAWSEHLIQNGADLNALDYTENSPLFRAANGGWADVVRLLLENGAKPDIDGYDGLKPIHVAARRNYSSIVKLLLEAGMS